jgi:hypothetical protein
MQSASYLQYSQVVSNLTMRVPSLCHANSAHIRCGSKLAFCWRRSRLQACPPLWNYMTRLHRVRMTSMPNPDFSITSCITTTDKTVSSPWRQPYNFIIPVTTGRAQLQKIGSETSSASAFRRLACQTQQCLRSAGAMHVLAFDTNLRRPPGYTLQSPVSPSRHWTCHCFHLSLEHRPELGKP